MGEASALLPSCCRPADLVDLPTCRCPWVRSKKSAYSAVLGTSFQLEDTERDKNTIGTHIFLPRNFRHASDLTNPEAGAPSSSGLFFRDHACVVDRNRGDHGRALGILGRRYFSNLRFHHVYTTIAKNEQGESQGSSGSGTGRYGVGANGSRKNRPKSCGMVPQPPSHYSSSLARGFKNARIFAKFRTGLCRVDLFCVQPRSKNRYRQFRLHCFPIGFYY